MIEVRVAPPSVYTGPLPFAMELRVVGPGTVVEHPVTGETATVDDGNVVAVGRAMFLTPTMEAALRDHPRVRNLSR